MAERNEIVEVEGRADRSARHSRRRVLSWSAMAIGAPVVLAACGAQTAQQTGLSQEAKPTTLEWFAKLKGINQADIDAFIQQYKTTRPNVTLNVTSVSNTDEGKAKIATFAAAGTPVDVVSTVLGIPTLRQLNAGSTLNDYIKRDKFDTTQFAQNTMRGVEVKGKTLALPHAYAGNEIAFVANKSLFAKAGVQLPPGDWKSTWTWQQFREAMKKLTNLTSNPPMVGTSRFGTIYNVPPMWGARWTSEDGKTVLTDKPEMVQAWTEYYDMVVKDRSTRFSPSAPSDIGGENPSFLAGKGATLTICCAVPTTTVQYKDAGIDWAFLPFPKAKEAVADINGAVIAIWAATKAPDEAWRFLRWSIEEGRLANLEQRMPSQTKSIQPYVQKYYGSMPDVRSDLLLKAPDYGFPPDALWQSPGADQADAAITAAFVDVKKGTKTVQAALTEVKPQLQALLDQYRD